jgi:hypothetical protein
MLPHKCRHDLEEAAAKVRTEAYRLLQEDIATQEHMGVTNLALMPQIVYMFTSGVMENRPDTAKVHAWALQRIGDLESHDREQALDLYMLLMHNDTEFAIQNLRRPLFDYDHWMPKQLESFWVGTQAALPDVRDRWEIKVPEVIRSPLVRAVLAELQHLMALSDEIIDMEDPSEAEKADLIYRWASMITHHYSGQLMNHYLDVLEMVCDPNSTVVVCLYFEAAVALTALFCTRSYVQVAIYKRINLRDAGHVIIPRIQELLTMCLEMMPAQDLHKYDGVLLWMYFAGAYYQERVRIGISTPGLPPCGKWFGDKLAGQAKKTGMLTWDKARPVMQRFAYMDVLDPRPDEWYEQIVLPVVDDQKTEALLELQWEQPWTGGFEC